MCVLALRLISLRLFVERLWRISRLRVFCDELIHQRNLVGLAALESPHHSLLINGIVTVGRAERQSLRIERFRLCEVAVVIEAVGDTVVCVGAQRACYVGSIGSLVERRQRREIFTQLIACISQSVVSATIVGISGGGIDDVLIVERLRLLVFFLPVASFRKPQLHLLRHLGIILSKLVGTRQEVGGRSGFSRLQLAHTQTVEHVLLRLHHLCRRTLQRLNAQERVVVVLACHI